MCVEFNVVLEGCKDLLTSPTQFFKKDSEDHWNKGTLAVIFFSFIGLSFLLNILFETFNASAANNSNESFFNLFLMVVNLHLQQLANAWLLILGGPVVLFLFLWGSSHVIKVSLHWRQALMLCLFFTLPPLLVINLLLPFLLLFIQDHSTTLIIQSILLLIITVWSLTVMILGTQAYSGASWQRSLIATLPVAMILFLQVSGAITLTILTLIGLNHATTVPAADPFSF